MPGQVGPSGGSGNSGGGITSLAIATPSGAVNGVNDEFVFASPPVQVFYQGVLQNGTDYALAGSTVTFNVAPVSGTVQGLIAS